MAYGYGYNQPYMPGMMQNQYQQRLAQMEQAIDYDMPTMILMQDELHDCYREKEKSAGIDIC